MMIFDVIRWGLRFVNFLVILGTIYLSQKTVIRLLIKKKNWKELDKKELVILIFFILLSTLTMFLIFIKIITDKFMCWMEIYLSLYLYLIFFITLTMYRENDKK